MSELAGARLVKLPKHIDADGDGVLVVAEGAQLPFQIQRMFMIAAPANAKRGHHAHRLCFQFVVCGRGAVDVVCDDGKDRKTFSLDHPELALLIPPALWVEIDVKQDELVLIVLCDRPYEEQDYISDYGEFQSLRKAARA